jgi:hypothetical protein
VDIIDPEMNLDPDEEFSDQLDEEEEEDEDGEGQGSPKEKDEDVLKSEGGHSQEYDYIPLYNHNAITDSHISVNPIAVLKMWRVFCFLFVSSNCKKLLILT